MPIPFFQLLSPLPLNPCPHVHSLDLCIYFCPVHLYDFYRFYIYALIYNICFGQSSTTLIEFLTLCYYWQSEALSLGSCVPLMCFHQCWCVCLCVWLLLLRISLFSGTTKCSVSFCIFLGIVLESVIYPRSYGSINSKILLENKICRLN